MYTYKIQGYLYHRVEPIRNTAGITPQYAQIYYYDASTQLQTRCHIFKDLWEEIVSQIQSILLEFNPFVKVFQMAQNLPSENLTVKIHTDGSKPEMRRYNAAS